LCNTLLCACGSEAFYLEKIGINIKLHQHLHQPTLDEGGTQDTHIHNNLRHDISQKNATKIPNFAM